MDVASLRSLPPNPPCYGRAKYSTQSLSIRVLPYKGCFFGRHSYDHRVRLNTFLNAVSRRNLHSEGRYTDVRWCYVNEKWKPEKLRDMKSQRSNDRPRNIGVRSDLAGAATPESAFPKPEIKPGLRIRGICFYAVTAIAAIFLFVLMLIGHPFVLIFDRYRRKFHYLIAQIWATITISPFYKIKFEGLENLPPLDTPAVYVSNHQSFLDIYTLLTLGRSFKFISKTGIFLFPIIGWAMFMLGVIPLKRMDTRSQMDCLKRCIDLVKKGASVFFFPEGTRSKDGKLGPFKKGAFTVASKTGAPVVPITLVGTGEIMPAGCEGIVNHGNVKVIVHKPIQGSKADSLCNEARNVIAESLNLVS